MKAFSALGKTITYSTILLGTSIFALAHEKDGVSVDQMNETQKVETRQSMMKDYKAWDKKIGPALNSEPMDIETLKQAGMFFSEHSGEHLLAFFPESTENASIETKAKSAIWRNWEEFSAIANDVETAGESVLELIEQEKYEELSSAFKPITNSCRSCHKKYKAR